MCIGKAWVLKGSTKNGYRFSLNQTFSITFEMIGGG